MFVACWLLSLFAMESKTRSRSTFTNVGGSSGSFKFREKLSITFTLLNGKNYAIWAQAVKYII